MSNTACPTHPQEAAQDACARCGSYTCNLCLAPGLRVNTLCTRCEAVLAEQSRAPIGSIGRFLRWTLVAYAVSSMAALVIHALATPPTQEELVTQPGPIYLLGGLMEMTGGLLIVVAAISWCVWFRRANRSLHARAMQLGFGPNAWAWFFVPFACLYVPYLSITELYTRATNHPVAPRVFPIWWGLWLLDSLLSTSLFAIEAGSAVLAVAGLLSAAGALAASQVVKNTTAALAAPPPGPEAVESNVAWTPDLA